MIEHSDDVDCRLVAMEQVVIDLIAVVHRAHPQDVDQLMALARRQLADADHDEARFHCLPTGDDHRPQAVVVRLYESGIAEESDLH